VFRGEGDELAELGRLDVVLRQGEVFVLGADRAGIDLVAGFQAGLAGQAEVGIGAETAGNPTDLLVHVEFAAEEVRAGQGTRAASELVDVVALDVIDVDRRRGRQHGPVFLDLEARLEAGRGLADCAGRAGEQAADPGTGDHGKSPR